MAESYENLLYDLQKNNKTEITKCQEKKEGKEN